MTLPETTSDTIALALKAAVDQLAKERDAALERANAAEKEREDRIDLDVAKRTVMIRAQLAQAVEAGNFVCGEMEHAIFELRCAFSMKETDTMTLRQLASAAKGAIEQGRADRVALDGCRGQNYVLSEDRKALKEALRVHGGHSASCKERPCTCGFKAAWDEWVEGNA